MQEMVNVLNVKHEKSEKNDVENQKMYSNNCMKTFFEEKTREVLFVANDGCYTYKYD